MILVRLKINDAIHCLPIVLLENGSQTVFGGFISILTGQSGISNSFLRKKTEFEMNNRQRVIGPIAGYFLSVNGGHFELF